MRSLNTRESCVCNALDHLAMAEKEISSVLLVSSAADQYVVCADCVLLQRKPSSVADLH